VLASEYVKIRDTVRRRQAENGGDTAAVVPITVRQLEALVRLSESNAKVSSRANERNERRRGKRASGGFRPRAWRER
jgi:DNA replicative helicase MCM subunit Mcm2 (Cdc46/Mcm family)